MQEKAPGLTKADRSKPVSTFLLKWLITSCCGLPILQFLRCYMSLSPEETVVALMLGLHDTEPLSTAASG